MSREKMKEEVEQKGEHCEAQLMLYSYQPLICILNSRAGVDRLIF